MKVDTSFDSELISLKEAAQFSGFSESYLRAIAQSGRLLAKKVDREWRTSYSAIEEYKRTRLHVNKKPG